MTFLLSQLAGQTHASTAKIDIRLSFAIGFYCVQAQET